MQGFGVVLGFYAKGVGTTRQCLGQGDVGCVGVVALVVEGPEDTWEILRNMMGATNPRNAAPGTIRGDYGTLFTENLIHGSDSAASAAREIGIFFPNL